MVTGEPHIRNFVGAPLVASNGHRLGTLCFLGPQPRTITAQEATILSNMAGEGASHLRFLSMYSHISRMTFLHGNAWQSARLLAWSLLQQAAVSTTDGPRHQLL